VAPENLSMSPYVWTGVMRLLTLPMDVRPAETSGSDADAVRRISFLAAAEVLGLSSPGPS
jgi:hypothetical protein